MPVRGNCMGAILGIGNGQSDLSEAPILRTTILQT